MGGGKRKRSSSKNVKTVFLAFPQPTHFIFLPCMGHTHKMQLPPCAYGKIFFSLLFLTITDTCHHYLKVSKNKRHIYFFHSFTTMTIHLRTLSFRPSSFPPHTQCSIQGRRRTGQRDAKRYPTRINKATTSHVWPQQ